MQYPLAPAAMVPPQYSSSPAVYQPFASSVVHEAAPMAVVPYQPYISQTGYAMVPYHAPPAAPVEAPRQNAALTPWLYKSELDPNTNAGEAPPARKVMYSGSLWRPLMDEAYFCAHLSHQTAKSSIANPGEVLQFQSSTNKTSTLTVVNVSPETPEIAWRMLSDGRTTYLIFRGSSEWMYPLFESKLAVLHDVAPNTKVKVHNLFLHELIPHMPAIISSLKTNPTRRIVLAGYGNGGGFATICFLLLQRAGYARHQMVVYTFGSPLVTCGNLGVHHPLPTQISRAIFNFVNEDDFVPSMLGNKDMNSVDAMVSSVSRRENPLKNGLHNMLDLKSFRPIGSYFQLSSTNGLVDIPAGREPFFLHVNRTTSSLTRRLEHHRVDRYVSKLRKVVQDN